MTGWGTPLSKTGWCTPCSGLDGVPPPRQQSEHLLRGGRCASCVHAGGLSCSSRLHTWTTDWEPTQAVHEARFAVRYLTKKKPLWICRGQPGSATHSNSFSAGSLLQNLTSQNACKFMFVTMKTLYLWHYNAGLTYMCRFYLGHHNNS